MKKIIVITGPTATKKSKLAIDLAQIFNAEIINADSFQIYKELNIGINKPSKQQLETVRHHLINSHSIYDEFDIKIFQDICNQLIQEITQRNKNVIICGGSNLYIDAVIKGYNLNKASSREAIDYFDDWEYDDIYQYVFDKDPEEAKKINYNNKKRIIRAAQIIYDTKQKKSSLDNQKDNYIFDVFIIETILDRNIMYEKINQRVDEMIKNNWVQEVKELLIKDDNIINLQAFKAIGYLQVYESIKNNCEVDVEKIKQITRNLAKKQMTWIRTKYKNKYPYNAVENDQEKFNDLVEKIKYWLSN